MKSSTLVRVWAAAAPGQAAIALHLTPCIIACPPGRCDALINPANEQLQGTLFSPAEANTRLLGNGIIYPPQAIDGLVHELGGDALWRALEALPQHPGSSRRCSPGDAVVTPAFGELRCSYSQLVHAVAPFYCDTNWKSLLCAAYSNAFTAAAVAHFGSLAVPLLGAGARGAPTHAASMVAASAAAAWRGPAGSSPLHVCFAVQEGEVADILVAALDAALSQRYTERTD